MSEVYFELQWFLHERRSERFACKQEAVEFADLVELTDYTIVRIYTTVVATKGSGA